MADDPLAILADDPVNDTIHHPYSAYNQGWDAAEAGFHWLANPYPEGRENRWWWYGWRDFTWPESEPDTKGAEG